MESRLSIESVRDWIRYLNNSSQPISWIARYESNLLFVLQQGLNEERHFRKSFELLSLVFPYFALTLAHQDAWTPLLTDALLMAQDIKDNELQIKVFRWMGEAYLKIGQHQSARNAFSTALERAEAGETHELIITVYTGLFKLSWFDLSQLISHKLVTSALEAAKLVSDRSLLASLYDALASAYIRITLSEVALGYGQTAFIYWYSMQDHSGVGRAAYTLSATYTHMAQIKDNKRFLNQAMTFLEIARDELAQTDDVWQYPLLTYSQASIYYQMESYDDAAVWYQQSLEEANRMNAPHYTVIAHHGLGLALSKLNDFESARNQLKQALDTWTHLNNSYEQVSVLGALAELEINAGQYTEARTVLDRGLHLMDQVSDSQMRLNLQQQYKMLTNLLDHQ